MNFSNGKHFFEFEIWQFDFFSSITSKPCFKKAFQLVAPIEVLFIPSHQGFHNDIIYVNNGTKVIKEIATAN